MQRSLFLFFFLVSTLAKAQQDVFFFTDGILSQQKAIKDTLGIKNHTLDLIQQSVNQGYYFAGIDSLIKVDDELRIYLHRGERLENGIENLRGKDLSKNIAKRVSYLAENGYPFASIRIDSLRSDQSQLTGKLVEEKGPLIKNDSAFFFTEVKTSHQYIYRLLEHVPNEIFNESNYSSINEKISRSSFLNLKRPIDISFQDQQARLYLDLEENEAGSFEGILGLQQSTIGKSEVVGRFNLVVQNLFKSGKEFEMKWERFRQNSQELTLKYNHPFVFGSKITPSFSFDLLKQDTTFLQRNTGAGLSTYLSPKVALFLTYVKRNGTLLTTDEQLLTNLDVADFESDLYQVRMKKGRFGDLRELNAGHAWDVSMGLGSKSIQKNLNLADAYYDTLTLNTEIFQIDFQAIKNFKLGKRQVINQQIRGGIIQNDELLNNERYRLGGLTSLRGFDEKSIFVDRFLLSRTELRSFFEKGSFLFVFYDQLFFKNGDFSDTPLGSGLGFSLATLSGQFSFALAIGKSNAQRANLAGMKAHFGYITRF